MTFLFYFIITVAILILFFRNKEDKLSLFFSCIAIATSIFVFQKNFPLSQANIVFPSSQFVIEDIVDEYGKNTMKFSPIVKNIGKSNASEITFSIYLVYSDKRLSVDGKTFVTIFPKESLVSNLQPDESIHFGSFTIPDGFVSGFSKGTKIPYGEPMTLIFFINYKDEISGRDKTGAFFYSYSYGSHVVGSLANSVFQNFKKDLEFYLNKEGDIRSFDIFKENILR